MHLYPHNYAEILAAIICTVCLLLRPSVTNKWFTGFLWLTVCIELTAKALGYHLPDKFIMYNLFGVVECCFYLLYFTQLNLGKKMKLFLEVLTAAIACFCLFDFLLFEDIKKYSTLISIVVSITIVFACLTILYTFLNSTSRKLSTAYTIIFIGLLIFYAGNFFPDASASSSFSKNHSHFFTTFYHIVNGYLNVFMYGCFGLAFIVEIWQKPPQRLTPI